MEVQEGNLYEHKVVYIYVLVIAMIDSKLFDISLKTSQV